MAIKRREDLGITDDYMFGSVMLDTSICRELIEAVLGEPVGKVELHERQRLVEPRRSGRGIRLDVYLSGSDDIAYDVEMQTSSHAGFERRLGYYRSALDIDAQGRGSEYDKMRGIVLIFFTTFDPFGAGLRRYDCETIVKQTGGHLDDGSRIVLLSSKGTQGEVDPRIDSFLRYMEDATMHTDDFTRRIDREVQRFRDSDDWYGEYMNFQLRMDEALAEGRAKGLEQGRAEGRAEGLEEGKAVGRETTEDLYARLARALEEHGRSDELMMAITDAEYRAKVLSELNLT